MLQRLMDRWRPKPLEDPVFGNLLFIRANEHAGSYWEGRGKFEPLGADIEYFIAADETGPGERQRELYRRIEAKFESMFATLAPVLRREYEAHVNLPCPSKIADAFRLNSLSIPEKEAEDMEWEMDFSCSDSEDWLFTVRMRGWEPTGDVDVMH